MLDPILNEGNTANNIIYTNKTRFQWRCNHNHVFQSTIRELVKKQEQGAILCPICRKWETKSMLLVDEYPYLFEEAYNWLNCPTLRKPEIDDRTCEQTEHSSIPPSEYGVGNYDTTDLVDFPFEELYIDSTSPSSSHLSIPSSSEFPTPSPSSLRESPFSAPPSSPP